MRILAVVAMVFASLYYLQFGLQALVHYLPQGLLALVGAVALGYGAARAWRRRSASAFVAAGTAPLLLLHLVLTIQDPGELPFLIGSIPAPLVSGIAWIRSRRSPGVEAVAQ